MLKDIKHKTKLVIKLIAECKCLVLRRSVCGNSRETLSIFLVLLVVYPGLGRCDFNKSETKLCYQIQQIVLGFDKIDQQNNIRASHAIYDMWTWRK